MYSGLSGERHYRIATEGTCCTMGRGTRGSQCSYVGAASECTLPQRSAQRSPSHDHCTQVTSTDMFMQYIEQYDSYFVLASNTFGPPCDGWVGRGLSFYARYSVDAIQGLTCARPDGTISVPFPPNPPSDPSPPPPPPSPSPPSPSPPSPPFPPLTAGSKRCCCDPRCR